MNIRKPTDYSAMYVALDRLMDEELPQVELYFEIGRAVCTRTEKGAAVAASEYLQAAYPETIGFSPRNLRRMREFFRIYENVPELHRLAMKIGWTQNVVILEAELTMEERAWYLRAAEQFSWSKKELADQISASAHLKTALDDVEGMCYTEREEIVQEYENQDDKDTFCVSRQYLQEPDGRVCDETFGEKGGIGAGIPHRISGYQPGGDWQSSLSSGAAEVGRAWSECTGKTARQLLNSDYDQYDLLIGMDRENLHNMYHICGGDFDGKMHLLMEYAGQPDQEVTDPWYTDDSFFSRKAAESDPLCLVLACRRRVGLLCSPCYVLCRRGHCAGCPIVIYAVGNQCPFSPRAIFDGTIQL